jgi:hypothetical protein
VGNVVEQISQLPSSLPVHRFGNESPIDAGIVSDAGALTGRQSINSHSRPSASKPSIATTLVTAIQQLVIKRFIATPLVIATRQLVELHSLTAPPELQHNLWMVITLEQHDWRL